MELLFPVRSYEQAVSYVHNGIKELYCGYINNKWITHFNKKHETQIVTLQISLNRRDYLTSNITDFRELEQICKLCKNNNVTIFMTLNAAFYSEFAYELIDEWLLEIEKAGIEHIIISDIGMMSYIAKNYSNFKITVSCENQVINSSAVKFYKQFYPERIVFPRHITVKEMESIIAEYPEMEFESFLISSRCIYDDGNCRCIHDIEPICSEAWITKFYSTDGHNQSITENRILKNAAQDMTDYIFGIEQSTYHGLGYGKALCSICSAYNLSKYTNFASLKVVGRGMRIPDQDIEYLKTIIDLSQHSKNIQDYRDIAQKMMGYENLCQGYFYCCTRGEE